MCYGGKRCGGTFSDAPFNDSTHMLYVAGNRMPYVSRRLRVARARQAYGARILCVRGPALRKIRCNVRARTFACGSSWTAEVAL
jgi:hypothetical protein